jgi:AmmeMemoRadiSam system protein B
VEALDQAHEGEHSLEVHLPFLQVLLGSFQLMPFVVGEAMGSEVAEVLERIWGDDDTVIIVSSDLSHFLDHADATDLDHVTAGAVLDLRHQDLQYEQACGRIPMAGLMLRAEEEGLVPECVDLRNSGDTAGPRTQVVGYGSFVFHRPPGPA